MSTVTIKKQVRGNSKFPKIFHSVEHIMLKTMWYYFLEKKRIEEAVQINICMIVSPCWRFFLQQLGPPVAKTDITL